MPKQKNGQNDMNKWKKVKISDSFILQMGKTPSRNEPSFWNNPLYNWVSISDMNQKYICSTKEKISPIALEKTGIKKVPKGTIMLSFKLSLGKVSISALDLYTNEAIMSFFPKNKNEWNIDFLYNYFKWLDWGKKAQKAVKGSTLNKNSLGNIEIPLPPMEEQKKIAARLDAVSDLLAKQKQLLSEQDNLIQSTFYDMFGTPFKNEKGFPYLQIKDLVSDVQYGTSQKADYTGKMPILRMNNITYSGEMDYTDLKYIDLEEETNKYILKKGDVLFNRTNSRELVGKTGLFNLDKLMVYAGYLIRVRLKEICLPIFLTKYMNTPQLKAFLKEKCKGIVGQANINAKEFQAIPIFLPPFELQQKFAAVAEQIESEKSKIKSAIAETQTLFNTLMAEYFED